MELDIFIDTDKNCKVTVLDNTKYLPEETTGSSKYFKYSDTASISVLKLNKLQENVIKDHVITLHSKQKKPISLPIKFDGWFTITYIVLPNKEWFDNEKNKETGSILNSFSIVYYTDGTTIYKYVDGQTYAIALDEILEVNPINTTLSIVERDYVSICFLKKCYINLCQQIFDNRGMSSCWNKNTVDSELIYKRDLVWMAINVIEYLTTLHSKCNPTLHEVERIIETINGCNGLCKSNDSYVRSNSGCGCSK